MRAKVEGGVNWLSERPGIEGAHMHNPLGKGGISVGVLFRQFLSLC